jgi:hypothetical protein
MQKGQTKCLSTLFLVRGFAGKLALWSAFAVQSQDRCLKAVGNIHVAIIVNPYQQNV